MDKENISGEKALIEERRKKLDQLRDRGAAYGNSFKPKNKALSLHEEYGDLSKDDLAEKNIKDISEKAKSGKLTIEDLQGGTFTISNGGVYGSMLSTPILNLPQSGVLGMHNIVDRPIVVDGEIKIRPIMYLALSYDHRIVDGKESVSFLKMIKENLEEPRRLFLDI